MNQKILEMAYALAEQDSTAGYIPYLRHVVVDCRPEPARFSAVARQWQWEWAAQVAPALEAATGHRQLYNGPRCFWRTLARGHDKTTGLARLANWALCFSRRQIEIVMAAADRDQAALLTEAMAREAELNPWLGRKLTFQRDRVLGPTGVLKVLTSDAPTAAGLRADLIIMDEVTHWERRDLWDMLWSGLTKRPDAVCVVITNAGLKPSWQWDIKEIARTSRRWLVYEPPGRLDTWMSEADIAEDRKLLLPSEARRLLDNQWVDAAEEAGYLSRAEVMGPDDLGRELGLVYQTRGRKGVSYWASADYGPKRDRTCLAIVHQRDSGLLVLDKLDVWQGRPEAPVPISDIRSWVKEAREDFGDVSLVADPYQLEELIQDLSGEIVVERFESRGGKSNYEMAELLRSLIVNRGIAWYPGAGRLAPGDDLVEELCGLITKRMAYGYRFDHELNKHDDRAVAVGMACVQILNRPRRRAFVKPPVVKPPALPSAPIPVRLRTRAEERGLYGMPQESGRRNGRF
jgi:hypothetical protein